VPFSWFGAWQITAQWTANYRPFFSLFSSVLPWICRSRHHPLAADCRRAHPQLLWSAAVSRIARDQPQQLLMSRLLEYT